jgi:hypothetical protein
MVMMLKKDAQWINRALAKAITDEIGQQPDDQKIRLRDPKR